MQFSIHSLLFSSYVFLRGWANKISSAATQFGEVPICSFCSIDSVPLYFPCTFLLCSALERGIFTLVTWSANRIWTPGGHERTKSGREALVTRMALHVHTRRSVIYFLDRMASFWIVSVSELVGHETDSWKSGSLAAATTDEDLWGVYQKVKIILLVSSCFSIFSAGSPRELLASYVSESYLEILMECSRVCRGHWDSFVKGDTAGASVQTRLSPAGVGSYATLTVLWLCKGSLPLSCEIHCTQFFFLDSNQYSSA